MLKRTIRPDSKRQIKVEFPCYFPVSLSIYCDTRKVSPFVRSALFFHFTQPKFRMDTDLSKQKRADLIYIPAEAWNRKSPLVLFCCQISNWQTYRVVGYSSIPFPLFTGIQILRSCDRAS